MRSKIIIERKWKNENGNFCFCCKMPQPMGKPWIIILITILLLFVVFAEYWHLGSYHSLVPCLFLLMLSFVCWAYYPYKGTAKMLESIMSRNVDMRLHNILTKDIYEIRRKFYQETKGSYGMVTGSYMLILLSNDVVLEYELKYHKPKEETCAYFEFVKKPIENVCPLHEKVVKPTSIHQWWAKVRIPEEALFLLILTFIIGIGGALFILGLWLFSEFKREVGCAFILSIGGFIGVYSIRGKSDNKILKVVEFIVSLPLGVISLCLGLMLPFMTVLLSYGFLAFYAFGVPFYLMTILGLLGLNISGATVLFITIAFGSILSVYGSKFMQRCVAKYSLLRDPGDHKYQSVMNELALYLINRHNINFLIYLAYFLFLTISGLKQVEYNTPLLTAEYDAAIMKAFLVFIAYSNMITKSKDVEIQIKPLFNKMIKLMT